eukprot:m.244823 g.244823  ORF g.244823 m.244823 type:complete len:250 (+) comp15356_c0_seq35:794-1543(+)
MHNCYPHSFFSVSVPFAMMYTLCPHYAMYEQQVPKHRVIAFINTLGRDTCFVFLCPMDNAQRCHETVLEAMREGKQVARREEAMGKPSSATVSQQEATQTAADASSDSTLSCGIGFKRRSSIRVNAGLRRKNSISFGKKKVGRSSSSFGRSLSSLSIESTGASDTSATNTSLDGEDDDLLADVDADIFGATDVIEEADITEDVALDSFGFDMDGFEGDGNTSTVPAPTVAALAPTANGDKAEDFGFGFD